MAQDNEQNRSSQPPRAPKTPAADPYADPAAYLKSRGRKPLGNPDWPNCLWINENKPMFAKEERVPKMADFLVANPSDPKKPKTERRQVKQRTANVSGHVEEFPVFQVRYTPPQSPMTMQQALLECMEEDHQKLIEAERKSKAAAA